MYCGFKGSSKNITSADYFISGRNLPPFLFIVVATATSFSGSSFLIFPGIIFRDGFQAAYISFIVLIIPLTGIFLLKRQWILSKNYGYITSGEMIADYFQSKTLRLLVVIIALFFSIPFLGIQLAASGKILNFLSGGIWNPQVITIILGIVMLVYISLGGLRSIAYADIIHCFFIWFGIVVLGLTIFKLVGGWSELNEGLSKIALVEGTKWNKIPEKNYSALFAIPDLIQLTKGIGKETPVGGLWTVAMIFSYVISFVGIQASPAFSMIAFSSKNSKPFSTQQVWSSSILMGVVFFLFIIIQGMGSHLLGADPIINKAGIFNSSILPDSIGKFREGSLVLHIISIFQNTSPMLFSLLALCAVAATQSSGALFISSGASMLTRDIYLNNFKPEANDNDQKLFYRIFSLVIVLITLLIIIISQDILILMGSLAISLSLQLVVPLISICYFPWFTKKGVSLGLALGIFGVIITDYLGQFIFGDLLPWGVWPLTIYSGFWGLIINLFFTIVISLVTQNSEENLHKKKFHDFLKSYFPIANNTKIKIISMLIVLSAWLIFAIGPGALVGNDIFGKPDDITSWIFGIPSIWAWQILFWFLGVCIIWYLAKLINNPKEIMEE
tara:strand:+ start:33 stop:1877 length:1845 start_codon:yes stop_codon:yes gene_type:complete